MTAAYDPRSVFLNVPFDRAYEPVFVGLIAALVHLGKRPTTVLDLDAGAQPRIDRLLGRIRSCAFSVHDLSRVERSGRGAARTPRFNMPFELGLAVAVARGAHRGKAHGFALLEARPYRLQRSLSDMNGYDPMIHGGTREGAARCMFELFSDTAPADLRRAQRLAGDLAATARQLKRDHGVSSLFGRLVFGDLVQAATVLRERAAVVM